MTGLMPIGGVAMGRSLGRPLWRYAPEDGQLHLTRRVRGVAKALCPFPVGAAELEQPGGEDQPRCSDCIREYGLELSSWDGGR